MPAGEKWKPLMRPCVIRELSRPNEALTYLRYARSPTGRRVLLLRVGMDQHTRDPPVRAPTRATRPAEEIRSCVRASFLPLATFAASVDHASRARALGNGLRAGDAGTAGAAERKRTRWGRFEREKIHLRVMRYVPFRRDPHYEIRLV